MVLSVVTRRFFCLKQFARFNKFGYTLVHHPLADHVQVSGGHK